MELGLNISQSQIDEMKMYADDINFEVAEKYEGRLRMLHLKDFANTTDRRSFVPIGDGILPLEDLVGFADSRNVLLVIDQDKSKDMMRDISRSIDNIRKYSYRV